jgi:hypothetical protein
MSESVSPLESSRSMTERDSSRLRLRILVGMALAALGLLYTFDNLGVLDADEVVRRFGWPVIVIAYGTLTLIGSRSGGGRLWGTAALLAGVAVLGQRLGLWHGEFRALVPPLLIVLGGYIVWRSMRNEGTTGRSPSPDWRSSFERATHGYGTDSQPTIDSGESISAVAVLAGIERRVTSPAFRGGELTAVLGGGQIDMREAIPAGGQAVIDVFAVMGGLEIRVPDSWSIEVRATPVLGAIRDTRSSASSTGPRLIVRGMVFLGGIEFKS